MSPEGQRLHIRGEVREKAGGLTFDRIGQRGALVISTRELRDVRDHRTVAHRQGALIAAGSLALAAIAFIVGLIA